MKSILEEETSQIEDSTIKSLYSTYFQDSAPSEISENFNNFPALINNHHPVITQSIYDKIQFVIPKEDNPELKVKKTSSKTLLIVSFTLLFITMMISFSIYGYKTYTEALVQISTIDALIDKKDYNRAYKESQSIKEIYFFNGIKLQADKRLTLIESTADENFKSISNNININNYAEAYVSLTSFKKDFNFANNNQLTDEKIFFLESTADKEFEKGIELLSSDESLEFSITSKFFKSYKSDFSFSKKMNYVEDLLALINKHNEKRNTLIKGISIKNLVSKDGDVIKRLESQFNDIKYIFELSTNAAINRDTNKLLSALKLYETKRENYADFLNEIDNFQMVTQDAIFTSREYDNMKKFILNGISPCEFLYQAAVYKKLGSTKELEKSKTEYQKLEPVVFKSLSEKKLLMPSILGRIESLGTEVHFIKKQIHSFEISKNSMKNAL